MSIPTTTKVRSGNACVRAFRPLCRLRVVSNPRHHAPPQSTQEHVPPTHVCPVCMPQEVYTVSANSDINIASGTDTGSDEEATLDEDDDEDDLISRPEFKKLQDLLAERVKQRNQLQRELIPLRAEHAALSMQYEDMDRRLRALQSECQKALLALDVLQSFKTAISTGVQDILQDAHGSLLEKAFQVLLHIYPASSRLPHVANITSMRSRQARVAAINALLHSIPPAPTLLGVWAEAVRMCVPAEEQA